MIAIGFCLLAYSCWQFGSINLEIATTNVIWPNILSGMAMGFIFVPLTTTHHGRPAQRADGQRRGHLQPDAEHRRQHRHLDGHHPGGPRRPDPPGHDGRPPQPLTTPASSSTSRRPPGCWANTTDPVTAQHQAYGLLYGTLVQQANLCAYVDTFRVLAVLSLVCIPFVFLLRKVRPHHG